MLKEDLQELGENQGNYKAKFIDKILLWVNRQSNCASSFICGPANFPFRSNQKRMGSCDKVDDFYHWRKKYFKAINRVRTKSPEEEIDLTIKELTQLEAAKENYKTLKKAFKNGETKDDIRELIVELFPKKDDYDIQYLVDNGVSYQIPSITTRIRERKKKIIVMKNRIEAKENQKDIYFKGGKIFIENDRVIIKHDEKPEREIINAIKKNGFRWSRNYSSWCRKHTGNARRGADYLLRNHFGGEVTNE